MFVDSRSLVVILGVAVAVVVVVAAQATPAFADTALQQGQGYAAQSPNLRSKQVDSSSSNRRQQVVVVEGGAYEFAGNDKPVTGATITALERPGWQVHTDDEGQFSFTASVNEVLTLVLSAEHMKTTQYSTVTVPPGGLTGHLSRIYFQVPSSLMYDFLSIVSSRPPLISLLPLLLLLLLPSVSASLWRTDWLRVGVPRGMCAAHSVGHARAP